MKGTKQIVLVSLSICFCLAAFDDPMNRLTQSRPDSEFIVEDKKTQTNDDFSVLDDYGFSAYDFGRILIPNFKQTKMVNRSEKTKERKLEGGTGLYMLHANTGFKQTTFNKPAFCVDCPQYSNTKIYSDVAPFAEGHNMKPSLEIGRAHV